MQTHYLFAAILAVFVNGDSHIHFDELATFTGLSDASEEGTTESCLYDPVNGLWRFWDRTNDGEADTLTGSFPFFDDGVFEQMVEKTGNATSTTVTGTVFVQTEDGDVVFIADFGSGEVFRYNVDDGTLGTELDTGIEGVNGLCYDEENNMLYATNVGLNFLVDPNVALADTSNIMRFDVGPNGSPVGEAIYAAEDAMKPVLYNSGGDAVTDYIFRPNGCTVKDGMVYFIETRPDRDEGGLLKYNIAEGTFVLNTEMPGYSGDGLITIGNFLIMSSWGDGTETAGFLSYYDLDSSDEAFVMSEATGLNSPADIGVDPYGTICVPSLLGGDIYFYKFSAPGAGYTLLDKSFDLTATATPGYSAYTYGMSYDANRNSYLMINNAQSTFHYIVDIVSIDAEATTNASDTDGFGYEGVFDDEQESVFDSLWGTDPDYDPSPLWGAQVIVGDWMYILDRQGLLVLADISGEDVVNGRTLVDGYPAGAQWTGLCADDPDDPTLLFAVNYFSGMIVSVDVSNTTVKLDDNDLLVDNQDNNNWEVEVIYSGTGDIMDQNDANARSSINPYDCAVVDGMVYIVDTGIVFGADTAFLTIYDIANEKLWYNADIIDYNAWGIASVGDILVAAVPGFSSAGSAVPAILISVVNDDETRSPFQPIETNFPSGLIDTVAIDYVNGVIIVNTVSGFESTLSFIQSDSLIMEEDTPSPTEDTVVMESSEYTTQMPAESDTPAPTDPDAANTLSTMLSIICGLILYLHL